MNDKEIMFIGKITAGITHEVNNVLASIREISGLMTDFLSMTTEKNFPHKEKFQTSLQKIQNQVQRGVKLTNQLNKFSHLTDNNRAEIDLNELIEHLIFLTERFARIKNVTLLFQPLNKPLTINTNPLLLQMGIFSCIEYLLKQMANGGEINLSTEINADHFSIKITCKGELAGKVSIVKDSTSSDDLLTLIHVMEVLNGVYEFDDLTPGITIKLPGTK